MLLCLKVGLDSRDCLTNLTRLIRHDFSSSMCLLDHPFARIAAVERFGLGRHSWLAVGLLGEATCPQADRLYVINATSVANSQSHQVV